MLKTKTPRSRGGKARRAPASAAKAKATAAEGSSPSGELSLQLEHVSLISFLSNCHGTGPKPFEALLEEESSRDDPTPPPPLPQLQLHPQLPPPPPPPQASLMDADEPMEEKDCCILSQDFFCTPDYITPEMPQLANDFEANKENSPCPKSPEKSVNARSKRYRRGFSPSIGGNGLSRYRTDFHEIEKIGHGNFSVVFKVLNRIDGCLYAVKRSIKQLHNDRERRQAVKEVQALAALGCHENIVGYFTSWFENEQLHIQMELCDLCLSMNRNQPLKCGEALELMYQVCKGLDFIHERGIAHVDVKPDNIYVRNGVYKIGDFGCATLIDRSLAIEDGDSRYMPMEMLNEKYEHLDKVDIFSLGASIYELIRGTPLPESGAHFIREGKIALLPGCPMQFQSLIKSMMDPDPVRRPSAKEILRHPIFEKLHKAPA
ncbi:wee1-like protein kinase isoform X2 [Phragmites australis]|uniref:wee1-like protein kinase isoform X2 n=1 Tax=Phragmites australis TaxID=29695 RepID=UPI002D7890E2|nr:wee1-like protein kinase isoform X2 [Phragmites australis]